LTPAAERSTIFIAMADFRVSTTSREIPHWVVLRAGGLGISFACLGTLEPAEVARRLSEMRPNGYLMNWPDIGPYLGADLLAAAPDLRIVTYMGQSPDAHFYTDYMDLDGLRERGILATTTPDTGDHPVAETTMALLLAMELDLLPASTARKAGAKDPPPRVRKGLSGSTLGIVGMGRIGRRVAELAVAFGMQVSYFSRTRNQAVEERLSARFLELDELFACSDYVTLHVPAGAEEVIDGRVLVRAGGVGLINTTSLAQVVEPDALIQALQEGRVRTFAMEGRYPEPYDSRLRSFDDRRVILLSPYGSYLTPRSIDAGWGSYLDSLEALIAGRDVPHQIRTAGPTDNRTTGNRT
jgi:lactate dehydrogenase-like 2-hydroxyacid dehydrogenase